ANEPIAVQGIADCIFIENGGAVIVDYKTDRVENEQALIDRYSAQLNLYAKAFEKILNMPIKQKIIYSFHL
ncbi:MAG: PD-(D/E)XK nuclease family protein, partial [Phoenicibacter congonensis]|nr:PD-(D/E)XK nuclease family protein [Phoenicibacter congonensis]